MDLNGPEAQGPGGAARPRGLYLTKARCALPLATCSRLCPTSFRGRMRRLELEPTRPCRRPDPGNRFGITSSGAGGRSRSGWQIPERVADPGAAAKILEREAASGAGGSLRSGRRVLDREAMKLYIVHMKRVTASEARRNWFRLLDEVVQGAEVCIERGGRRIILKLEPEVDEGATLPDYASLLRVPRLEEAHRWGWWWSEEDGTLEPRG